MSSRVSKSQLKRLRGLTVTPPSIKDKQYDTDDFMMFQYKVQECPAAEVHHSWAKCPFIHRCFKSERRGAIDEKRSRRDPRKYNYSGVRCMQYEKNRVCDLGDRCLYSHGALEWGLHPDNYRKQNCPQGSQCTRHVCFYAHNDSQRRDIPKVPAVIHDLDHIPNAWNNPPNAVLGLPQQEEQPIVAEDQQVAADVQQEEQPIVAADFNVEDQQVAADVQQEEQPIAAHADLAQEAENPIAAAFYLPPIEAAFYLPQLGVDSIASDGVLSELQKQIDRVDVTGLEVGQSLEQSFSHIDSGTSHERQQEVAEAEAVQIYSRIAYEFQPVVADVVSSYSKILETQRVEILSTMCLLHNDIKNQKQQFKSKADEVVDQAILELEQKQNEFRLRNASSHCVSDYNAFLLELEDGAMKTAEGITVLLHRQEQKLSEMHAKFIGKQMEVTGSSMDDLDHGHIGVSTCESVLRDDDED